MSKKNSGTGVGKGHGGNSNLPLIRAIQNAPHIALAQAQNLIEPQINTFKMGKVNILVGWSPEFGWHISISHPERYPTWDEVAKVRYELVPDEVVMGMILPSKADYINIHNFCFHLHELPAEYGR